MSRPQNDKNKMERPTEKPGHGRRLCRGRDGRGGRAGPRLLPGPHRLGLLDWPPPECAGGAGFAEMSFAWCVVRKGVVTIDLRTIDLRTMRFV